MRCLISLCLSVAVVLSVFSSPADAAGKSGSVKLASFAIDASPPIGSPLAYDPVKGIQTPLSFKGVVLTGCGKPIVLCAVDWIGIGNEGQTVFKERIAQAAGTTSHRVVVHTLHQHDAPRCDFSAEKLMSLHGASGVGFDPAFMRQVVERAANAVAEAMKRTEPVTQIGLGSGKVEKVASNRRILGPDGKVQYTRWTATRDPKIRAFPVGTIDPNLKLIAFYNQEKPLAVLTFYATHPQSYYRTGLANPDFPGMARNAREKKTGVPHIHFNGAGGNIGAGKWNDGSHENRQVLADRVEAGMKRAWEHQKIYPVTAADFKWETEPVCLPVASHLDEEKLLAKLKDKTVKASDRFYAAKHLAWLRRCKAGDTIDIACLSIKNARILYMPGELFVEYQLAAQKMREDLFVCMAAYGEYAPGYIGTEIAYSQGGYETSNRASRVSKEVEKVLMDAMRKLLE